MNLSRPLPHTTLTDKPVVACRALVEEMKTTKLFHHDRTLSINNDPIAASLSLQYHANLIDLLAKKWRVKINEDKSAQITFVLNFKPQECPQIIMNNIPIPIKEEIKYLRITLDKRLTWGPYLIEKRKSARNRLHLLRPLLTSKLQLKTKLLVYKSIICPVWSYGIQIWGPAKPSNIRPIQSLQSIALRLIIKCPWYITNINLHKDIQIQNVKDLAVMYYKRFHQNLLSHRNPLINKMSTYTLPSNPPRILKRQWNRDLLNN